MLLPCSQISPTCRRAIRLRYRGRRSPPTGCGTWPQDTCATRVGGVLRDPDRATDAQLFAVKVDNLWLGVGGDGRDEQGGFGHPVGRFDRRLGQAVGRKRLVELVDRVDAHRLGAVDQDDFAQVEVSRRGKPRCATNSNAKLGAGETTWPCRDSVGQNFHPALRPRMNAIGDISVRWPPYSTGKPIIIRPMS